MPAIRSRISSSSSTTRISDVIGDPVLLILYAFLTHFRGFWLLCEGECQRDQCALAAFRVRQRDLAPVVLHDLAHDRQTQPRALGAGGDIRLGQAVTMLGREADAIVAHRESEIRAVGLKRDLD